MYLCLPLKHTHAATLHLHKVQPHLHIQARDVALGRLRFAQIPRLSFDQTSAFKTPPLTYIRVNAARVLTIIHSKKCSKLLPRLRHCRVRCAMPRNEFVAEKLNARTRAVTRYIHIYAQRCPLTHICCAHAHTYNDTTIDDDKFAYNQGKYQSLPFAAPSIRLCLYT